MTEPPHPTGLAGTSEMPDGVASADDLPAVELRDIWKRFPGVVANAGAHLRVRAACTLFSARTVPGSRP